MNRKKKPPTERTWMNIGATRVQARRLLSIQEVEHTDDDLRVALRERRATNAWPAALQWLDLGYMVTQGDFFIRSGDRR